MFSCFLSLLNLFIVGLYSFITYSSNTTGKSHLKKLRYLPAYATTLWCAVTGRHWYQISTQLAAQAIL